MIALYPGSFDPVTVGHMDIIARASGLFDSVVVGVFHNPVKPPGAFLPEYRARLILQAAEGLPNIEARVYAGLVADGVRSSGAGCIVRGVRSMGDIEIELQMARLNRQLCGAETLLLASSPETAHISAGMVRQIGRCGGDLSGLVPEPIRATVARELLELFQGGKGDGK